MSPMWMVYAVVVGLALGAAAYLVEVGLRAAGRQARAVWAAALAGSWLLPILAWLRPAGKAAEGSGGALREGSAPLSVEAVLSGVEVFPWPGVLASAEPWLPVLWAFSVLLALTALAVGAARLRRRARAWPRARVDGTAVRLSDGFGPAVLGVFRPEIVLPRWVVELEGEERVLVLRHEQEHARARDTLLLAGGAAAAALMPWNPALWWQLARLRQAVELDCDARVVAGHPASALRYGRLLLQVGERLGAVGLPAAALAGGPPLLSRRVRQVADGMRRNPSWRGRAVLASTVVAAVALVAVACETPSPTRPGDASGPAPRVGGAAAEVDGGGTAGTVGLRAGEEDAPDVYVDDVLQEDHRVLRELAPEAIERIEVLKGSRAPGPRGAIYIYLKDDASEEPAGTLRIRKSPRDGGG